MSSLSDLFDRIVRLRHQEKMTHIDLFFYVKDLLNRQVTALEDVYQNNVPPSDDPTDETVH